MNYSLINDICKTIEQGVNQLLIIDKSVSVS